MRVFVRGDLTRRTTQAGDVDPPGRVPRRLEAGRAPRFRFVTDRFEGIEIIGQFGSMHGANTMAL